MTAAERNNVQRSGVPGGPPMLFAHGFGCDLNMWRLVAPHFEDEFEVVLFDHVGAGGSDLGAYDPVKYASLAGYADDVLEICDELGFRDVIFVGHSVSAMIGAIAARKRPERFTRLVMVGPSPRTSRGSCCPSSRAARRCRRGRTRRRSQRRRCTAAMAPVIIANADRPELGAELAASFCRSDPGIARAFARVTFLSDNRADLPHVHTPTLVLQCSDDVIAPIAVGEYVRDVMPDATYVLLDATGHCPNLSAPAATAAAIDAFVRGPR